MKNMKPSIFDQMIAECIREDERGKRLDSLMLSSGRGFRKVPVRYRIIAAGFAERAALEELNEELMKNDCPKLYSRNFWEAGLIYAFSNGMTYPEWRRMESRLDDLRALVLQDQSGFGNRITLQELKEYVEKNSEITAEMRTVHLTRRMDEELLKAALEDEDSFRSFVVANIFSFSPVREKTRYYFCKYLYYYLRTKIDSYLNLLQMNIPVSPLVEEAVLDELCVLKGVTKLKRKKMTADESLQVLSESAISCGEIFNAFNHFYYGYVSLDWMEVLMDAYGSMERLTPEQKAELAEAFRHYDKSMKGLSDDQVMILKQKEIQEKEDELDAVYSRSNPSKGYQRNRSGENTIRKYLRGSLDIDRMTLICFLMFFGSEIDLSYEMAVDRRRMDEILTECGFAPLRVENHFDHFVIQYMEASDPSAYLMEEVTEYAENEENFYLYKVYLSSRSEDQELKKILGLAG